MCLTDGSSLLAETLNNACSLTGLTRAVGASPKLRNGLRVLLWTTFKMAYSPIIGDYCTIRDRCGRWRAGDSVTPTAINNSATKADLESRYPKRYLSQCHGLMRMQTLLTSSKPSGHEHETTPLFCILRLSRRQKDLKASRDYTEPIHIQDMLQC
jgi:hypothetical protein